MTGAPTAQELVKNLDDHAAFNYTEAQKLVANNLNDYQLALELSIGLIVGAFVIAGILGFQLYRIISSGLENIQSTLEHVSQSLDFTQRVSVVRQDEIGLTAMAFNRLLETQQASLQSSLRGATDE